MLGVPNIDPLNGGEKREEPSILNSYIIYHILSAGVSSSDAVSGMRGE